MNTEKPEPGDGSGAQQIHRETSTETSEPTELSQPMAEPGFYSLRRFFYDGFTAGDLAEPLISWDAERPAEEIRTLMERGCLRLAGIRYGGLVQAFVLWENLGEGSCGEHATPFEASRMIDPTSPLHEVVKALDIHDGVFLAPYGSAAGIVTRSDLEKPQGRMWLFGLLTVVETAFTELLREHYPGEQWTALISPGRIERARSIQEERRRMGTDAELLDCLQFGDKGYAVFKDSVLREKLGFASRRRGREVVRDLERLRNALAHTQPVVPNHWDDILRFSGALDRILALYHRPRSRHCRNPI